MPRKKKIDAVIAELNEQTEVPAKTIEEYPEQVYIYHKGDDLPHIAKLLTGHEYLMYKMLMVHGLTINDIPEGFVFKWRI